MAAIADITAREILDSRGNPTVEVDVPCARQRRHGARRRCRPAPPPARMRRSSCATATNPATAARACCKAVANVEGEILDAIGGMDPTEQVAIDNIMIDLDGTPNKAGWAPTPSSACRWRWPRPRRRISAAAVPLCRRRLRPHAAGADDEHRQWRQARRQSDRHPGIHDPADRRRHHRRCRAHGLGNLSHTLKKGLHDAGHNTNVGDEGGFAPNLKSADEALGFIAKAVEKAGYRPGEDITFALDCAATEFFKDGKYDLEGEGKKFDAEGMVDYLADLVRATRSSRSRTAAPRTTGTAGSC
jgi:enolase